MEFFEKSKTVRLKGHHGKYLWADEDQCKISQNRENKNEQALWRVERVSDGKLIRLVSCYNTYLTASDEPFLLGMTGKKAMQSRPKYMDSSVEWEPVSEGGVVKLKTCHGNYLRANHGLPPWRGSVTHDLPSMFQKHQEFLLWVVETVKIPDVIPVEGPQAEILASPKREAHQPWVSGLSPRHVSRPKPDEGRLISYTVADENGEPKNVEDDGWSSFRFKGHSLKLLQERLREETGITGNFELCARHPLSTKLYALRLGLPPNNAPMHIVVVPESSALAKTLPQSTPQKAVPELIPTVPIEATR